MLQKILSSGLIAGVVAGLPLFLITVALQGQPPPSWGMALGYLTMLVALSVVFVAVKRHRDTRLGGVIRFWPAFGMGLAISLVAGIVYVLAWEATLAYTGIDFAGEYAKTMIAEKQAEGVTGEALAKYAASIEEFRVQYSNPAYRMPITLVEIFPVGVLVSLVAAALLRNSRFMPARAE